VTPFESFFDAIEHSGLSLWVRGPSLLAFPLILTVHTIGMGFLAGTSSAIDLRILGVARRVPLPALEKFYPVIWIALAANFATGLLLLTGYPYKAVTNPVFYVKLSFIALGVVLMVKIRKDVLRMFREDGSRQSPLWRGAQWLAALSLLSWIGAITAGRLLAYTYTWLRVGIPGGF
jgi:hypothetical protein